MSETSAGDILMFFAPVYPGPGLAAETTSDFDASDRLMTNFRKGFCFEVDTFGFALELDDDEGGNIMNPDDQRTYSRWRALTESEDRPDPPFKAEAHDVSITRMIDSASPALLKHCLEPIRFDAAVLVKRARLGTTGRLHPILRMEFLKVWIKSINWDDGDTVKETIKFKYASVDVSYVQRQPDGSAKATSNCKWDGLQKTPTGRRS